MATLDDLRKLANRVRQASEVLDDERRQRDEMIREIRQTSEHTVPEIASAADVSQATVKVVLRGLHRA